MAARLALTAMFGQQLPLGAQPPGSRRAPRSAPARRWPAVVSSCESYRADWAAATQARSSSRHPIRVAAEAWQCSAARRGAAEGGQHARRPAEEVICNSGSRALLPLPDDGRARRCLLGIKAEPVKAVGDVLLLADDALLSGADLDSRCVARPPPCREMFDDGRVRPGPGGNGNALLLRPTADPRPAPR